MLESMLFPPELHLAIQQIERAEQTITIFIGGTTKSAVCPECGTESDTFGAQANRVHSVYRRYPQDLPLIGHSVRLCIAVRRYFCDHRACGRRTFAERFLDFLVVKARRTGRLLAQQEAIGFAV